LIDQFTGCSELNDPLQSVVKISAIAEIFKLNFALLLAKHCYISMPRLILFYVSCLVDLQISEFNKYSCTEDTE